MTKPKYFPIFEIFSNIQKHFFCELQIEQIIPHLYSHKTILFTSKLKCGLHYCFQ